MLPERGHCLALNSAVGDAQWRVGGTVRSEGTEGEGRSGDVC